MMKSKKIFNRVVFSFAIVVIVLILVSVISIIGIYSIDKLVTSIFQENVMGLQYNGEINVQYQQVVGQAYRVAINGMEGNRAGVESEKSTMDSYYTGLEKSVAAYDETIVTEEERNIYNQVTPLLNSYKTFTNELYSIAMNGTSAQISAKLNEGMQIRTSLMPILSQITDINKTLAENSKTQSESITFIFLALLIGLVLLGLPGSIISTALMLSSVEKDLKQIIAQLTSSTQTIDTASTQLAEASESLANGSSRQAAAIEETSATVNEAASMIKQTAENTRQAAQLATTTNRAASDGMAKMKNMVQTMEEIKESSDLMSKTIKVIDDIAFQTNLLAINATVEAARAGVEAGRSFGVVAEEVRNLAQRSADAAADTAETIEKNVSLTNQGREVSRDVAEALERISSEADELSKIINEINAASEEQSSGVTQINTAMTQMEKVTQQNAAVAEENAASSNSMKDEIANLHNAVSTAQQLLRNSDSVISTDMRTPPNRRNTGYTQKPVSYTPSSQQSSNTGNSSSYKSSSTSTSSNQSQTNAEKIIPLDDDDNF